jgi:biotin carboxyl carrier protein
MKYEIESASGKHIVELEVRPDVVRASIDGREAEVKISQPEAGLYTLLVGNRVFEARVEKDSINNSIDVLIANYTFKLRVNDRKHRRRESDHGSEGRVSVVARMPGKVVRLLTACGGQVKAGDGIVVLEAMKMQNEVKAPKAGTVVELCVQEGQTINTGETLAVVE